ncbi:MAG: hypothetical protein MUF48_10005 [Pirellulaceae bacterium]|nr:hypothetical protein [Pirellulaceae bacterium]
MSGLVLGSIEDAKRRFKGGEPNERRPGVNLVLPIAVDRVAGGTAELPLAAMSALDAEPGDILYISDARWWLGGLRSVQVRAAAPHADAAIKLSAADVERGQLKLHRLARVQKLM